jgi:hypothetical protein
MKLRMLLAACALALPSASALAADETVYANGMMGDPYASGVVYPMDGGHWHTGYYHTMWAKPLPLVVPPTAQHQTMYGWGIGNTRIGRVYQQFEGPAWGQPYMGVERWYPTPYYPYDTLQMGVYYIRGPW